MSENDKRAIAQVIDLVKSGKIDDYIADLSKAIDERNEKRRNEILDLVRRIWGDEYTITIRRGIFDKALQRSDPIIRWPVGSSKQVLSQTGPISNEEGIEIESRSPVFDSVPPIDAE